MLRCNSGNCRYGSAHYDRHGSKFGFGSCGCSAMSDTEYDNDSDGDDDWMVESAVPPVSNKLRSPTLSDRRFPAGDRHSLAPGPPNRQRILPIPAEFKFHANSSFDSDSVCSGTFTIDLSTLEAIQRWQQTAGVGHQPQFSSSRNSRPSHSLMPAKDPVSVGKETGCRVSHPYPHGRHQRFSDGCQFHDRMADDGRIYQAPQTRHDFAVERGRYEQFRNCGDHSDCKMNPHSYESTSYDVMASGYRCQQAEGYQRSANYMHLTERDLRHEGVDGYRRPPGFSGGFPGPGRRVDLGHGDPAIHRSSARECRYSRSHFSDRQEEYHHQQAKDRCDFVPIRDSPASQTAGRPVHPESRSFSCHSPRTERANQNWQDQVPVREDSTRRYIPPASSNDPDPVCHQKPTERWTRTLVQDDPRDRARGSSPNKEECQIRLPAATVQPRQDQKMAPESQSSNHGSHSSSRASDREPTGRPKHIRFEDETGSRARSCSSALKRHELNPRSPAIVQPRQNRVVDDGGGPTSKFEVSSLQSIENTGGILRESRFSSEPEKVSESFSRRRPTSCVVHTSTQDDPESLRPVPDRHRGSDGQNGHRSSQKTVEQDTKSRDYRRLSASENKTEFAAFS